MLRVEGQRLLVALSRLGRPPVPVVQVADAAQRVTSSIGSRGRQSRLGLGRLDRLRQSEVSRLYSGSLPGAMATEFCEGTPDVFKV